MFLHFQDKEIPDYAKIFFKNCKFDTESGKTVYIIQHLISPI